MVECGDNFDGLSISQDYSVKMVFLLCDNVMVIVSSKKD